MFFIVLSSRVPFFRSLDVALFPAVGLSVLVPSFMLFFPLVSPTVTVTVSPLSAFVTVAVTVFAVFSYTKLLGVDQLCVTSFCVIV